METPPFRDNDETPRRRSDMKIGIPNIFMMEASGHTVIIVLLILALVATLGAHHYLQDRQQDQIAHRQIESSQRFADVQETLSDNQEKLGRIVATFTCVLTLTEAQRREFRVEGKYCGDYETNKEVRAVIKPEGKK